MRRCAKMNSDISPRGKMPRDDTSQTRRLWSRHNPPGFTDMERIISAPAIPGLFFSVHGESKLLQPNGAQGITTKLRVILIPCCRTCSS